VRFLLSAWLIFVPFVHAQTGPDLDVQLFAKLVFPDLTVQDGTLIASRTVPVRSDFHDNNPTGWSDQFRVQVADQRAFKVEQKHYFAMLFTTGDVDDIWKPWLLAVFDRSGSAPRLVDAVQMRLDQECRFGSRELLGIECTYHNSQQARTFHRFLTVDASGKRIVPIAEIPLLNQQGVCGASIVETLTMNATTGQGIVAFRVKAVTHPDEPKLQCRKPRTRQRIRYFSATYLRDPISGRYRTLSKELDSLATWNQRNY
jgi:hypothetical protein